MSLNIYLPEQPLLRPRITVFGVGGAGGNAVNNMIQSNLCGVNFVVANTDAQALELSLSEKKIQLGIGLTKGLGAGSLPEIGRGAAEESINEIIEEISDSNMLFITAGMGGGTGTGAAPVIAKAAKENKILTIGVVTKPFHFEGAHRMRTAELGLEELQRYVDTLIVIPNQNLFRIANEKTTFADAFKLADTVLHTGVQGITDLMVMPGLINLDFADIQSVMGEMGKAMMGTGEAEGEDRAIVAAEAAISNPLLDNVSMKGAKGILINITGGLDMTLFEVDAAANRIREEVDNHANIIFGSTFNKESEGKIRVSVLATGIDNEEVVIQNKSMFKDSEVRGGKFSEISNKPFNPLDNEIAYYKPSDPGDDAVNSVNRTQKNYSMGSQSDGHNLTYSKTRSDRNEYWDEDSFNIPTFLRKK
ncbi:MAG: cell division protein FtsZ [Ehrlichia sp.]